MNRKEFQSLIDEHLTGTWGEKSYPPVILSRLWAMVQHVSAGDLKAALDAVMLTSTRAPNLGQIKGALLPALQRAWEDIKAAKIKTLPDCLYCAKTGWMFVIPFEDPCAEGVFLCSKCEAAKVRGMTTSRGAMWWEDGYEHKFFVRKHRSDAWLEANELQQVGFAKLRKQTPAQKIREAKDDLLSGKIKPAEALAVVEEIKASMADEIPTPNDEEIPW